MEFSADTYIAFASAFVAVCALVVTLWQGRQNYKHNMLSVRPFIGALEHYSNETNPGQITFELINCGVGPAIIKNFTLLYDGKEVSRNNRKTYEEFLKDLLKDYKIVEIFSYAPGAAMQAGEKLQLLTFQYDLKKQNIDFTNKLNLLVDYQCLYQRETFTFDSRDARRFQGREAA
ncbi:MAG: hypothetical protein ABL867_07605 [Rickettsiales bacterium]